MKREHSNKSQSRTKWPPRLKFSQPEVTHFLTRERLHGLPLLEERPFFRESCHWHMFKRKFLPIRLFESLWKRNFPHGMQTKRFWSNRVTEAFLEKKFTKSRPWRRLGKNSGAFRSSTSNLPVIAVGRSLSAKSCPQGRDTAVDKHIHSRPCWKLV